ncbi:MAG: hypothetical protein R2742_13545 [Micropruina glycogenica]
MTNSLALLVDAAHMLTDAAGRNGTVRGARWPDDRSARPGRGAMPGRRCSPRPAKPRSCSRWAYS